MARSRRLTIFLNDEEWLDLNGVHAGQTSLGATARSILMRQVQWYLGKGRKADASDLARTASPGVSQSDGRFVDRGGSLGDGPRFVSDPQ